jgi:hypothetical protein
VQLTVPAGPVAVPVKVVLLVILPEVVEPDASGVTAPTPLSILKEVAPLVVQLSTVVPPPTGRSFGDALSVHAIVEPLVTVTGAEQVTVLTPSLAVPV